MAWIQLTPEQHEDAMIAQLLSRPPKLKTCKACDKVQNAHGECDCS
jgi:hypothetical protein